MGALLDFKLVCDLALMYVCYADESKIIFVRTILSTTMTTTDAGLTQVELRLMMQDHPLCGILG